jgi:hypothetical protein
VCVCVCVVDTASSTLFVCLLVSTHFSGILRHIADLVELFLFNRVFNNVYIDKVEARSGHSGGVDSRKRRGCTTVL